MALTAVVGIDYGNGLIMAWQGDGAEPSFGGSDQAPPAGVVGMLAQHLDPPWDIAGADHGTTCRAHLLERSDHSGQPIGFAAGRIPTESCCNELCG
jgi:hypothetical protein